MIDTVALDPAYSPLGEPVTAMVDREGGDAGAARRRDQPNRRHGAVYRGAGSARA